MPVRIVTSEVEFADLKTAWNELHESNANHTPFQSWEWNFAWWKHFGQTGDLRLLVVESHERLIGIAPLFLNRRYEGAPLRHIAFISRKRADYLDFIVAAGAEGDFFKQVFSFMRGRRGEWRFLELRDMRETSANLPYLLREAAAAFPHIKQQFGETCGALPLASTWEEYLASLGANTRQNVGRFRRRLAKAFEVDLKIATQPHEMQRCLADFAAVFRDRWQPEQGATFFDQQRAAGFERELCDLAARAGWYRLYILYVSGKPVAGYLGYVCNQKFYSGLLAHDPAWHKYSVGTVMIGMIIEDCIRQQWSEFDMTRGDEPYKFQWNCERRNNHRITLSADAMSMYYASMVDSLRGRLVGMQLLHRLRAAYRRRPPYPDAVITSGA